MPTIPSSVVLVPYDPSWPETFAALRAVYLHALGEAALAVEHVGSTAVPGLSAKPIIDVDIVIAPHLGLSRIAQPLARLGYRHAGCQGIPGRDAFKRDESDVPRDGSGRSWPAHHLYACAHDANELRRHLAFRDWLRTRPEHAADYAALKQRLAALHPHDRERYCEAKTDFIEAAILHSAGG